MSHIKTLSAEQVRILLEHLSREQYTESKKVNAARNKLMILIMLDAGLRVGEVTQLIVNDLIYQASPVKTIRVRAAIAKNKVEREIPTSERIENCIRDNFTIIWPPHRAAGKDFAFYAGPTKAHITARQVQKILKTESEACLGKAINPHMLRHTFATRISKIAGIRVAQQLLGHSSIKTTQIYTHPDEDDRRDAINALA